MSICKKIVQQMGGSIIPKSIISKGTEFEINIKTKCKLKNKNSNSSSPAETGESKPYVFIMKDNQSNEIKSF